MTSSSEDADRPVAGGWAYDVRKPFLAIAVLTGLFIGLGYLAYAFGSRPNTPDFDDWVQAASYSFIIVWAIDGMIYRRELKRLSNRLHRVAETLESRSRTD